MIVNRNWLGDLWTEMNRVKEDMDQLFARRGFNLERTGAPAINLWEDEDHFYAETDLPGVSLDTLDISVLEGNRLSIQGVRKAPEIKNAAWLRQERPTTEFVRVVTLPTLIDSEKVEAHLEQGVLKIKLPKSEAAKPRKITVRAN